MGNFEGEILAMFVAEDRPLGRKETVARLGHRLGSEFSDADMQELRSKKRRWEKNARWAITLLIIWKADPGKDQERTNDNCERPKCADEVRLELR